MKISTFFLAVSVVANVALVVLIVSPVSNVDRSAVDSAQSGSASATVAAATGGSPTGINAADVSPKLWENLSAGDYAALTERLRAQGFPPSIVRAIVGSVVSENFAARRKALTPPKTQVPFWQAEKPADPKTLAAMRELSREQSKLMKELLGPNMPPSDDPYYLASQKRQFGDLPTEKVEQLRKVQQDYGELRGEIYSAAGLGAGGPITLSAEDRSNLALLEKEQRADMQQLLSPQEFEDYELRSSQTANSMRYQLSAFEPSEQEFRTIFPLQRAFDEQYRMAGVDGPMSQDAMRQRSEAQKQLIAQIAAALGPERGAEYERAADSSYQQIHNVVSRLDLPKEAAIEVWSVQKDMEQRMRAIYSDPKLPPAARNEQLAGLAQEATTKLASTLGQRGLEVYKQYAGYWMQGLQPRQNTPRVVPASNAPP
jgi:hypothetical protein